MRFDIMAASGLLGAAGLALLAGCSGGSDLSAISASDGVLRAGTLQIPLTATAPSGALYRLDNAVFEITNPFVSPPVSLELPADADTLSVELAPSAFDFDYTVFLRDGWELRQVAADGSELPVAANLVSSNPTSSPSGRSAPPPSPISSARTPTSSPPVTAPYRSASTSTTA